MAKILTLGKPKKAFEYTEDLLVKSFAPKREMDYQMGMNSRKSSAVMNKFLTFVKSLDNEKLLTKEQQLLKALEILNKGIAAQAIYIIKTKGNLDIPDGLMNKTVMTKALLTCQLEELRNERLHRSI